MTPTAQEREQRLYELDNRINWRGLPIDLPLVHQTRKLIKQEKTHLRKSLRQATGLDNPASPSQFLAFLRAEGHPHLTSVAKPILQALLPEVEPTLAQIIHDRLNLARSHGKWDTLATIDQPWVMGMYQFLGASRTGRWAGRLIQPHNLHRVSDPDTLCDAIMAGDLEYIRTWHGDPMDIFARAIRGAIKAPEGKKLVVCDLGSIESRMVGWLSGCQRINTLFTEGKDTYKDLATRIFHKPYDEITRKERTYCKPIELGCIYRLGGGQPETVDQAATGLIAYAKGMGVEMSQQEADHAVQVFRAANPEVVQMWYDLENMVRSAIVKGTPMQGYAVQTWHTGRMLKIRLPSGRDLSYDHAKWEKVRAPWGDLVENLTYLGQNQITRQWVRMSTHGGKTTENIDQAASRDVLGMGLLRADAEDLEIHGHVHDEIICLADEDQADETLTTLREAMIAPIDFLPGLGLDAAGYVADRYRKD